MRPVIVPDGQRVIVVWRLKATRPRGARLDVPVVNLVELRDGKVAGLQMFHSDTATVGHFLPHSGPASVQQTLAAMDQAGVSRVLLCAWSSPTGMLIDNDEVAKIVGAHPDRFSGVAPVDLRHPMAAVAELRRAVIDLGFVGLRIVPWLWTGLTRGHRHVHDQRCVAPRLGCAGRAIAMPLGCPLRRAVRGCRRR